MRVLAERNLVLVGTAGILGISLIASVWQLWRGPVLIALFLALAALSWRLWPKGPSMWFLVVAALALPLSSLAHNRDVDHLYGLSVFLFLGGIGLLLGLHSSLGSIAFGILVFHCFLIALTAWSVVVSPESSFNQTDYHSGALMGPFHHRNILGAFLGLGMVPLIFSPLGGPWVQIGRWILVGVTSILLVATQSLTPVLALGAAALYSLLMSSRDGISRFLEKRTVFYRRLLIFGGATSAVSIAAIFAVLMHQARPTLVARFDIWELVVRKLLQHFPHPPEAKWISSAEVVRELGFNPVHAHNALLSLFLIYGIVPTIVFILALVGALAVKPVSFLRLRMGPVREAIVSRGLLVYVVVHSTVETVFLAGPVGFLLVGTVFGTVLAPSRQYVFLESSQLYLSEWANSGQ